MIADVGTCEWNPGSHRSMVDPVVAVARLDMPAPMRTELVEKIKRHQFDDVVSIHWASITSDEGRAAYAGDITNMNFADGRICKTVTRDKWTADQVEGAIVYRVGSRAFGYAAACGNLFELVSSERKEELAIAEAPLLAVAPVEPLSDGPTAAAVYSPAWLGEDVASTGYAVGGYIYAPIGGGVGGGGFFPAPQPFPCPVPAVPEPSTWLLSAVGLAILIKRVRKTS